MFERKYNYLQIEMRLLNLHSNEVSQDYAILKMSRKYDLSLFSNRITHAVKLRLVNRDLREYECPLDQDL